MRRLLIATAILTGCINLLLLGIHALHAESVSAACIQLLSPTTGDVLTVDLNSGAALLDPHAASPSTPASTGIDDASVSPDQTHVADTWSSPPALLLGIRSTAYRSMLTANKSYDAPVWSPDSRYLAFGEIDDQTNDTSRVNLAIAAVNSGIVKREPMLERLNSSSFGYQNLIWSPDSTTLAAAMYSSTKGGTLALRAAQADQSIFISFSNRRIDHMMWSPNSQVIIVFAAEPTSSAPYSIYFIGRNGRILNQLHDTVYSPTIWYSGESSAPSYAWSPDGNYFYMATPLSSIYDVRVDIFRFDGIQMLTKPLRMLRPPLRWANLPHTLLYVIGDGDPPSHLYRLDAQTGQSQVVLANILTSPWPTFADSTQTLAVIAASDDSHYAPHVISADLSQITTPFGEITPFAEHYLIWSPTGRSLLMIAASETATTSLSWWLSDTGEVHQLKVDEQGNSYLNAYWLTDDILLITMTNDSRRFIWRVDLHSTNLTPLVPKPERDYWLRIHELSYLIVDSLDAYNIYHVSDGSPIFTKLPRGTGKITPFIEPHERAVLLFHSAVFEDTHTNYRQLTEANLNLVTQTTNLQLASTDNLTSPAWSSDGETFAFGVIEPPHAGWTLKLMHRDGSLLRSVPLPAETNHTPYRQLRWMNCE